jgi:hypothetical protein
MNNRHVQAWAAEMDERPSYHSSPATWRVYDLAEHRSGPALWRLNARRRRYQLRLMRARMEMEESLGR